MRRQRRRENGSARAVDVDGRIAAAAAAQSGVLLREQLVNLGLGPHAIDHRVRAGRLHVIHRGVYAVGHAGLDQRGRDIAALLAAGPTAVLSHRSAGAIWRFTKPPPEPEVTVPGGARRSRPGLRLHRTASLEAAAVRRHDDLRVTSPARTLRDLARVLGPHELERATAEAQVLGLVPRDSVDAAPTRSELERSMLALLGAAALPHPRVNTRIGPHEVDFAWPRERLAVEVDGWAAHSTRRAFERDRARDAELQAAGHAVLRFTWRQVRDQPLLVAARVAHVLGRRAA
jgi:very-short-patch-repair endonuclease